MIRPDSLDAKKQNSPGQREERLLDTLVRLRARLQESQPKLVRKLPTLLNSHCAFLVPIAFVSDEDFVDASRSVLLDVRVPSSDVWGELRSAYRWGGGGCGKQVVRPVGEAGNEEDLWVQSWVPRHIAARWSDKVHEVSLRRCEMQNTAKLTAE